MSLLPYLLDETLLRRPSRLLDQRFGLALDPDDLFQPMTIPKAMVICPAGYVRNWRSAESQEDCGSTVTYDKEKFQVNLDVQQFKPEEISVKVTGENTITIEGKHEEKEDKHGQIYRHFVRTYKIPKNCDMSKVDSKLSSDGVLSITAPMLENMEVEHTNIPITQTGEPAKEKKKDKKDEDKKLKEK